MVAGVAAAAASNAINKARVQRRVFTKSTGAGTASKIASLSWTWKLDTGKRHRVLEESSFAGGRIRGIVLNRDEAQEGFLCESGPFEVGRLEHYYRTRGLKRERGRAQRLKGQDHWCRRKPLLVDA